jgi:hypothetical protein
MNYRAHGTTFRSTEIDGADVPLGGAAYKEITPNSQASTNAFAVVTGTETDLAWARTLAFTIVVAGASVDWKVFGANRADYTDEVEVNSATVAAAAKGNYTVSPVPYRYYRVKIKSTVADTPGNAGVYGIAKG